MLLDYQGKITYVGQFFDYRGMKCSNLNFVQGKSYYERDCLLFNEEQPLF